MALQPRKIFYVAINSIVIAIVVMLIKYCAYILTGSVALLSDAMESLVNIITACVALWAVSISSKPADAEHPFGHHKVEYFSSVLEGILILFTALFILHESFTALFWGSHEVDVSFWGIALSVIGFLINMFWCSFLTRFARSSSSPALQADARHLFVDVLTSLGVFSGLVLIFITGWTFLDSLIAAGIALHIFLQGLHVTWDSLGSLMDRAASDEIKDEIWEVICESAVGALEVHDLKTRSAGSAIFVEFHMVLPGSMTVSESHAICDRVEHMLCERLPNIRILIHVEPEEKGKKCSNPDIVVF